MEVELPVSAEVWGATVNGNPVKPVFEKDKPNIVFIPLVRTSPADRSFITEIQYVFMDAKFSKSWSKSKFKAPVIKIFLYQKLYGHYGCLSPGIIQSSKATWNRQTSRRLMQK